MKKLDFSCEKPMADEAPMYIFATESVSEYYKKINIKDKRILTVSGSGDQVLGAYYAGAKEVTAYDINKNSKHILNLKIVSLKNLTYTEFLGFFGIIKNKEFDYNTYKKIRNKLPDTTRNFFDELYKLHKNNGRKLRNSESIFRQREKLDTSPREINDYLKNEKSFLRLRKILEEKKPAFVRKGVNELSKLRGRYDILNLSNIPNYLVRSLKKSGSKDPLHEFYKILIQLKRVISPNGIIFYYIYSKKLAAYFTTQSRPITTKPYSLKRLKDNGIDITIRNVKGIIKNSRDKIAIIKS